jgi:hypothetical protein
MYVLTDRSKHVREKDDKRIYSPAYGGEMYTQLLASWSIEKDRVSKYTTRVYFKTRKQATRSEKELDLTNIPSTVKQVKESREMLTKLKTSIANSIPLL